MKKKIIGIILIIAIMAIITILIVSNNKSELKTIKSEKQLEKIYNMENTENIGSVLLTMPFSLFENLARSRHYYNRPYYNRPAELPYDTTTYKSGMPAVSPNADSISSVMESAKAFASEGKSKDFSKTNIQVENVDEADIIKTDGDYIYSLSQDEVIITDVKDPKKINVVARIKNNSVPRDMIIYNNKLVIISVKGSNSYTNTTSVSVYNITDKQNPTKIKDYELYEPYYTTRCIDGKLYVMSCGNLRKENNKFVTYYYEDNIQKDIGLKNIQYLKDVQTYKQTIISMYDLNNTEKEVNIKSYLLDINNAYISENNIYLLDNSYGKLDNDINFGALFGFKGVFGIDDVFDYNGYAQKTRIYKFNILDDGAIKYSSKVDLNGRTINQYSLDEFEGNLRVALQSTDGSRIVVLNENLKEIGKTSNLAKGENMYSSRFVGNKAYLVTYKTVDPLFVIDLSNPTNPKVLGELKIPGYSTYLHPYDENYIIGIGMDTKENISRDRNGNVISTSAYIVGMKMALFDVSDVNNPKQISSVSIGDSRTTSAILTNPKALLFSKEKNLIAIPVNNYPEAFEIPNRNLDTYENITNSYTNYYKKYIGEGYAVYNINVEDGITPKGNIIHEVDGTRNSYYNYTRLLRGLYIDNNLYTVSEKQIKVNDLEKLDLVGEMFINPEDKKIDTDTILNKGVNE